MARPALSLAPQRCDKCMRCLRACGRRAIDVGAAFVFVDWDRCDGCGKCAAACEAGAIRMRGGPPPARSEASVGPAPARLEAAVAAERPSASVAGDERAKAPRLEDIAPLAPAWTAWEVAVVLAGVLALFVAQQAALGSKWMADVVPIGAKPLVRSGVLALYYAAQLALLAALGYRKGVGFAEAFGLRRFRPLAFGASVVALVAVTRAFTLAYAVGAESLGWKMPAGPASDLTLYFGRDGLGLALTVVMIVVVGPFFEELVFRGVLAGFLQESMGAWPAVVVSALVFAAFHANGWMFAPVAVMGLGCAWAALRTRSLWAAYVLHMLYNAVPVFLIFALAK